jgi:sialate O-acetylesterase
MDKVERFFLICSLFLMVFSNCMMGEVSLSPIFSSRMVIQRDQPIKIWGWAEKGETVQVTLAGHSVETVVEDSFWMVELPPMKAGGPHQVEVNAENKIILEDVLIGDVWLCSGQSNMVWTVANSKDAGQEIGAANYPGIRLLEIPNKVSLHETLRVDSTAWSVCSPETVKDFSAVAYYFGRDIHTSTEIPIGLISSNWGGTIVETWMSPGAIGDFEMYKEKMAALELVDLEEIREEKRAKKDSILALVSPVKGLVNGEAFWANPELDETGWRIINVPGLWEHQGLQGLDGVVWFRKEIHLDEAIIDYDSAKIVLGMIDDYDQTWVNGQLVGETNKYNITREYKLPKGLLREGKNNITVRVEDVRFGGGMYGEPEEFFLAMNGDTLFLAGDWKYRISPENVQVSLELIGPNDYPTLLYNGMIFPLLNVGIRGVIWYQGEANTGNPGMYGKLFPAMIKDWRKKMDNDSLAFLFVQLANYMQPDLNPGESQWAELREAQTKALDLPLTGMAVAIDIGKADNIHPKNKQDVGHRLALAARKIVYNENIIASGPVIEEYYITGDTIVIKFDKVGEGLVKEGVDDPLGGFQIAGKNNTFVWADAKIAGKNKVKVYSDKIMDPVAVRYAWADNPTNANLYNSAGLPAIPFRTNGR